MPQSYIDFAFVKENASFERILEHYNLVMHGTGTGRSISCPFHPDKRPSCRVELDKKIWHCFACEASGNALEFVARMEGDPDDLRAAAIKLADICSIATAASRGKPAAGARQATPHSRKGAGRPKPQPEAQTPSPAPPAGAEGPVNPPLTFELKLDATHPYLAERGVSAETIATFGLGYCSRGVMAGRVCIPIHNAGGDLVAYAGRWPGEPPEGVERYLLPKRFEKSRVLFNLHRVSDAQHLVLVEGYWSTFRLHAMGVPVAALMGSSVSDEQLALLRERGTRSLTVLWDGDDAGRKARERALPALADSFFVRAPALPDGEKPDTLGDAELRKLVAFSLRASARPPPKGGRLVGSCAARRRNRGEPYPPRARPRAGLARTRPKADAFTPHVSSAPRAAQERRLLTARLASGTEASEARAADFARFWSRPGDAGTGDRDP